ncbi:MAG TPA: hypothetical protein VLX92_07885 [Kofleriaceae bacterium]|nr:hypothetical protein [Kofleriaceae bacterium]
MSKTLIWFFATALAFGCGGAPKPEARLSSDEGAIRGAKEGGADNVPEAQLELTLATEQRQKALDLIQSGDNHRAEMMLARSEADAELALALARAAAAKADAQRAEDSVESLKRKADQ